jgi:chemotaxis protein histidine kinase CheA
MNSFRQHFLAESIDNLIILRRNLAENLTGERQREAFRIIHTIKGGAQTFGLETAAGLAHELEHNLSNDLHAIDKNLLLESVEALTNALRESEPAAATELIEKLRKARRKEAPSHVFLTGIPRRDFRSFSEQERSLAIGALSEGRDIYCAEAGFEVANFADEYRKLRKILCEKSEILASLPGEKHTAAGKIGFRIFLASREPLETLRAATKDFTIEISSHACADQEEKDLYKMLSQIAVVSEETAEKAGKQVSLTILSNDAALSAKKTKAFFDILLHLVRNAVDHAIERRGAIEIRFFEEPDGLYLSVADDGRGIDLEKVRARAVEKNLMAGDDVLGKEEALALVFAPGFSTARCVTEISGRGVGLDAVKAEVEKMNGKISVKMRKTTGTIFEIFVPREQI